MDRLLALRLDQRSSHYDASLYRKLAKMAADYRQAGQQTLDYYIGDLDCGNDMVNCYAAMPKKERDRYLPDNFIHPMGATELWTLATFVSQILFGGESARRVEPRSPEDEPKADTVNQLLRWNDNLQDTYGQGFAWVLDSVTVNRGVMYDHWQDMYEVHMEPVEYEVPYDPPEDPETGRKIPQPENYVPEKATRYRKVRKPVGGFVKIENISPYDFVCDPSMPIPRMQQGRFCGHRVLLTWQELERRSKLDPTHYEYVLPEVVKKLKSGKARNSMAIPGKAKNTVSSRTAFERARRAQGANITTGSDKIDKEDGGIVECWPMVIRAIPSQHDIFEDDNEPELIELLLAGDSDLLSVNILTAKHDQYPYSVGEARQNRHMQFSPSWSMIIKGCQDYVDYLKNRRKESLARTSGNIFIGNPKYIDFEAFTDPNKDGLIIPITEEGEGRPIDQIIKQIPVTDLTAGFHNDMLLWQQTAEQASGAHANTQGAKGQGDPTATEFVGTQQMAEGRISTIARLLSSSALVPQTQRIVENLQQYLPDEITIRITGEADAFDPDAKQEKFKKVIRDASVFAPEVDPVTGQPPADAQIDPRSQEIDIQGTFDVVPHDGSLPGADARKVAALSRAVEAYSANPAFAEAFDRTRPGAIDPIKLFQKLLKATGFPTAGLIVNREEAMKNTQERMLAQGIGTGMPQEGVPPAGQQPPTDPTLQAPSADQLPPTPPAAPPQPSPQLAV